DLFLGLKGGATSTGTFAPAAGTTIRLQGGGGIFGTGAHTLNAVSTTSGDGTIAFSADTTNVVGNFSPGLTSIEGGAVTFNAAVTARALSLSSGTLAGTGTLTVSGLMTWTGGLMTGTGTTRTGGGLTLSGSGVKDLTNQRTLQTGGTTTWTAGRLR